MTFFEHPTVEKFYWTRFIVSDILLINSINNNQNRNSAFIVIDFVQIHLSPYGLQFDRPSLFQRFSKFSL